MEAQIIKEQSVFLTSTSQERFFVKSYLPSTGKPKGILQIMHGMAEHHGRYHELGMFLAENGYGVFINDHPGHGQTAGSLDRLGYIPKSRGWEIMLENTRTLYTHIKKNQPEVPVFLLGHSMGSILARHFIAVYPVYIQGLILSGTFEMPNGKLKALGLFVKIQGLIYGPTKVSKWFNKFFFNTFNRHFKPQLTPFEWISSSREEVDEYVRDPYCGFDCSVAFFDNLAKGIAEMKKAHHNLKYRKTLPLLIMGGQDDPVGNFGKDAMKIHREFYLQRFQNLKVKVFHGRHEMFHETEKEKVFLYLLDWLNEHLHTR
ncbi:MAG: alpha/beta fold hydrolase [Bacteroides sp.]|jgi:alpha-beta hydrolase superfamily lysophospholipase|nr:alpha/beta fold hydrolase [Bacteroides sp.]